MNVICPNCGGSKSKLSDRECPDCHFDLSLSGIFGHLTRGIASRCRRLLTIKCPQCQSPIPFLHTACANGHYLLLDPSLPAAGPAVSRIQRALSPTPAKISLFQWLYAAVSVAAFWLVSNRLMFQETFAATTLKSHALLAFFVACFMLLTAVIVPRETLLLLIRGTSSRIKIALLLNLVTALLLFEVLLVKWWARFIGIAMLFTSIWLGALVFWKVLWPLVGAASRFFVTDGRAFDPKAGQGRRVRMD